jgi:predicted nucleotidyltransferase
MRRTEVIDRLKQAEPAIRTLGASALYLFGSHARDEAGPNSDVDVFIHKDPARDFGMSEFMGIYLKLRDILAERWTTRHAKVS